MIRNDFLKAVLLSIVACIWIIIGSLMFKHTKLDVFLKIQSQFLKTKLQNNNILYDDGNYTQKVDLTGNYDIKIITFTDTKHIKVLMNWLLHLNRLNILESNIVVMAFDKKTYDMLKGHLNPLYELMNLGINDPISLSNVWYYRVKFMLEYMRNNKYHIWISDNDNNFLYNPFDVNEFVHHFYFSDIMASKGVWPNNWNCQFGHKKNWINYKGIKKEDMWKMNHVTLTFGNLIIKNNNNTQLLFERILSTMKTNYGNDDMKALNCILKNEFHTEFSKDLVLKNEDNLFYQSILKKNTTLRVTLLPYYRFIINSGLYCKWNTTYCHSIINNNIKNHKYFPITWHEFKHEFYTLNNKIMPYFPSLWMLDGYQNMCDSRLKNITINC